ncbi:Polysaccharide export protein EpsE [Candidatus Methylobacter favarea]|uniref:Polysaccharide export protein EpsE n=1 Tax=Candidatus Methylobacter favarea TaxID=2707345 RepID=A0A8S0Y6H7_9GAMM|nr:polysaccharide biosynthesis/export family protein [Candidatus Methylobacter favarea]CAA9891405.1 Polysaccharide export protein EpsE [Candidatus Methylobacter favarea]
MRVTTRLHGYEKYYSLWLALLLLASIQPSTAANNIGPDDVIRISVYGYEDLKTETSVSTDGRITFPLIGEVEASGKTSRELEKAIAGSLIDKGFIQDAQVSVTVLEHISQQISVLGYINKPGRYTLNSDSSVVDLIAMAGGINDMGDSKAIITRSVGGKLQKYELNLRVYLEDAESIPPFKIQQGDVVYLPKAPMFYIYGEVQHPGGYRLEPDITVVKALPIAGGLTLSGTENGMVIKRKNESGALQEIDVDLSDAVLKDDVIYVDKRWF